MFGDDDGMNWGGRKLDRIVDEFLVAAAGQY